MIVQLDFFWFYTIFDDIKYSVEFDFIPHSIYDNRDRIDYFKFTKLFSYLKMTGSCEEEFKQMMFRLVNNYPWQLRLPEPKSRKYFPDWLETILIFR